MQSVTITTNVLRCTRYNIIMSSSDLRQVGGFLFQLYHGNKTKRNENTNYMYYCTHTNKHTKKQKFETKRNNIANLNIYIYILVVMTLNVINYIYKVIVI